MLKLFTDTDCDVTPEIAKKYGYDGLISMPYSYGDKEEYPYETFDTYDSHAFYENLRAGNMGKTCAISPEKYTEYFEPHFANGDDILYVHFSPAMSGTFNAMNIALEELKEKYPERKLYTINTKAISALALLLVEEIGTMHQNGATIEEILAWAETEVDKRAIYFYCDDLSFFMKSGRVSNIAGFFGKLLNMHPIIHMDSQGVMNAVAKAQGKVSTLKKMITMIDELQENIQNTHVIIAHTDLPDIAELAHKMLEEKYGKLDVEYVVVNPTVGTHCGPYTVGVAFHAKRRLKQINNKATKIIIR